MAEPHADRPAGLLPGYDDWRRLVDKGLNGRDFSSLQAVTRDGIVIEPLYLPRRDVTPIPGRGAVPWTIVQYVDDPDPDRANAQLLEDLAGGANGFALCYGAAPSGGQALARSASSLALILEGVPIHSLHLRIEPHPLAWQSAAWLRDLVLRSGVAPERARIDFGLDPVGVAAQALDGTADFEPFSDAFRQLHAAGFRQGLATLGGRVVHEAGGTEAQELAVILASAACWLRALDASGMAPDTALPLFSVSLAADQNLLLSLAKVRAVRLLLARLQELCDAPGAPLPVHVATSRRMMTRADPHTNILRTTIAAFAAAMGGADSIAILPHADADRAARAIARNLHHLLIEEAQVHRVADPAAGSGAVESLTDALAESAWREFQALETEGGILESLRSGAFQARVSAAGRALHEQVARGEVPLIGATLYRLAQQSTAAPEDTEALPPPLGPIRLEQLAREPA